MIGKIWRHKNLKGSFIGALNGLFIVLKTEKNAKIIFIIGIISIILGFLLKLSLNEFIILIIVTIFVFTCEVFNTLVENILDIINPDDDPRIKILKDISSAAVLLASLGAALIGLIIFVPKIIFYLL